MDTTVLLVAAAIVATLIVAMFIPIGDIEKGVTSWFERVTARPRWFIVWILVAIGWMPLRVLLLSKHLVWYTPDTDNVFSIILWSVVPFMVENIMKTSNAKAMELLTQMVTDLGQELDSSKKRDAQVLKLLQDLETRDEAMYDLYSRIVELLKDDSEGGDELAS